MPSPKPGELTVEAGSPFVASGPVWELARRRQAAWGYTDDEMMALLGWPPSVVDVRGLMLRGTAERILRRLASPVPATAGTHDALVRQRAADASHPESSYLLGRTAAERVSRIKSELRGEVFPEAPSRREAAS